jgi:transposase-like protein
MRRYSEAVKADVRRRMRPPQRQSVAQISAELGIHVVTLYSWRKAWRLQGEVVPASQKDPEGWGPAQGRLKVRPARPWRLRRCLVCSRGVALRNARDRSPCR